jgi:LysM repeat protein
MTTTNPIIPPGSPLNKGAATRLSKFSLAVFAVLAVHVALLAGLLIQGCKRDERPPAQLSDEAPPQATLVAAGTNVSGQQATSLSDPAVFTTQQVVFPTEPVPTPEPAVPAATTKAAPAAAKTHLVLKGETFSKISKAYGVTIDALIDANPNVEPSRVQAGQKIKIPEPVANGSTSTAPHARGAKGADSVYIVRTGDNLTRIARNHGTTVPAIRAANSLSTDRILVGQRLTIPAPESSGAARETLAAPAATEAP